jgi:hypothetical protein
MTTWGPGALDEMCIYFLWHYPAQDGFGYCSSFGTQAQAGCDAGPAPELVTMLYNKASPVDIFRKSLELVGQGKMTVVGAINPATRPYQPACKQQKL